MCTKRDRVCSQNPGDRRALRAQPHSLRYLSHELRFGVPYPGTCSEGGWKDRPEGRGLGFRGYGFRGLGFRVGFGIEDGDGAYGDDGAEGVGMRNSFWDC